MDTGKSLRMMQEKHNIRNKELAYKMHLSVEMISIHRNGETMNGKTVIAFADFFGVSCWEFIKEGESSEN